MNSIWKWIEEGGGLKIKFFGIQEIICSYFKIESLTPWNYFHGVFCVQTVLKEVRNPMFFHPQSAEKPPIGFPSRVFEQRRGRISLKNEYFFRPPKVCK